MSLSVVAHQDVVATFKVEVLRAQPSNDVVAQLIRDGRIRNALFYNFLDALKPCFGFRGRRACLAKLAVYVDNLLFREKPPIASTHTNNVLFFLEFEHSAVRSDCLFSQLEDPVLQPSASATRSLVFGLKLVRDVSVRQRVGDCCRTARTRPSELNVENIGVSNSPNIPAHQKARQRTLRELVLRCCISRSWRFGKERLKNNIYFLLHKPP